MTFDLLQSRRRTPPNLRLGGLMEGVKRALSRGERAPLVVKGLICRCKEGSQQKGIGK